MRLNQLPPEHPLNAIGSVGVAAIAVVGLLTLVFALTLFGRRGLERRLWTLGLALAGLLGVEGALYLVCVETVHFYSEVTEKTYILGRFSEGQRDWAQVGLIGVPVLVLVLAAALWGNPGRDREGLLDDSLKEGLRAYFQRDYPAALISFTSAVKLAPDRADPFYRRGCVFEQMGEYELALADLDRALARDSGLVEAYLHRGIVRAARGEYEQALADFDQANHLRPPDAEYHLHRGICLERKGDAAEAVLEFEKVLRKTNHPDFAEPALKHLKGLGAVLEHSPKVQPPGPAA